MNDFQAITGGAEAGPSDRQLVARTLAGDADAFAQLHRRYFARVYRIALFRCRNQQDAEDIASETFVKAIAHLGSFRFQGESLFPWLSRIATNLALDQGRRASGVTLVSLDTPTADSVRALIEGIAGVDVPDPHALAERHETQEIVRAAVATLAADQAEAVLMRFGSDMPLKEIAVAMGRTEGAVKSLLHRALVNLRKALLARAGEAETFGLRREAATAQQQATDPASTQARATEKRNGPFER